MNFFCDFYSIEDCKCIAGECKCGDACKCGPSCKARVCATCDGTSCPCGVDCKCPKGACTCGASSECIGQGFSSTSDSYYIQELIAVIQ